MSSIARGRYASGRLELRLEESRHLSAWLGVQEALHDRVLTLDEALAELDKVTPEGIQSLAQRLFTDDRLCMAVISPRGTAKTSSASYISTKRKPMTERTLILIKPDGVQRALIGKIVERYEARGLRIVGMKMVHADRALAEHHYAVHREKPFFAGLVEFIISAPLSRWPSRGRTRSPCAARSTARRVRTRRRRAPSAAIWRSTPATTWSTARTRRRTRAGAVVSPRAVRLRGSTAGCSTPMLASSTRAG